MKVFDDFGLVLMFEFELGRIGSIGLVGGCWLGFDEGKEEGSREETCFWLLM